MAHIIDINAYNTPHHKNEPLPLANGKKIPRRLKGERWAMASKEGFTTGIRPPKMTVLHRLYTVCTNL